MRAGTQTLIQALQALWMTDNDGENINDPGIQSESEDEGRPQCEISSFL